MGSGFYIGIAPQFAGCLLEFGHFQPTLRTLESPDIKKRQDVFGVARYLHHWHQCLDSLVLGLWTQTCSHGGGWRATLRHTLLAKGLSQELDLTCY